MNQPHPLFNLQPLGSGGQNAVLGSIAIWAIPPYEKVE